MNAYDRCDKCGAQALARFRKLTPLGCTELDFCQHHANQYAAALDAQSFRVVVHKELEPA